MQPVNAATQTGFLSAAAGVQIFHIALAALAGLIIGYGSGFLSVFLEKREKLEQEELEERADYEKECAQKIAKAKEAGEPEPELPPWKMESYGWTWIEKYLVPAATALLFGVFIYHQGWSASLPIRFLWVALFTYISGFDLKHRLILNVVTYPSIVLAIALVPLTPDLNFGAAIGGAAFLGLIFFLMGFAFRGGIGLGDAKLVILMGAILGIDLTTFKLRAAYAVFYGIFLSGFAAVILLATRVVGRKDPIPYAPFLCAGALIVLYAYPVSP